MEKYTLNHVNANSVLWIWIQIGTVFSNLVDLDPYFEFRSGYTQLKIGKRLD